VTSGYWNRSEETARSFSPDGWLRSGDAGRFEAKGFAHLVERLKDVIVVSGFKVFPHEVEAVATTYPGVLEAAATHQKRQGASVCEVQAQSQCAPRWPC
jgi:long-chain acyl-CoA synthetase